MEIIEENIYYILVYFGIGILTYLITSIDDFKNISKNKTKTIQNILLTLLCLFNGIGICVLLNVTVPVSIIVSILCGFFGGSVLQKIDARKSEIGDTIVDTIKDRISSIDISKAINTKKVSSSKTLEFKEHIKEDIEIDSENTFVDEEQTDYNPFENVE